MSESNSRPLKWLSNCLGETIDWDAYDGLDFKRARDAIKKRREQYRKKVIDGEMNGEKGKQIKRICSREGCDRTVRAKGLCSKHYNREHRSRLEPLMTAVCQTRLCPRSVFSMSLCRKHYVQLTKYRKKLGQFCKRCPENDKKVIFTKDLCRTHYITAMRESQPAYMFGVRTRALPTNSRCTDEELRYLDKRNVPKTPKFIDRRIADHMRQKKEHEKDPHNVEILSPATMVIFGDETIPCPPRVEFDGYIFGHLFHPRSIPLSLPVSTVTYE